MTRSSVKDGRFALMAGTTRFRLASIHQPFSRHWSWPPRLAKGNARRTIAIFAVFFVLLLSMTSLRATPTSASAATTPEAVSVAYQIDAAHDGDQPNETLTSPTEKWSVTFGSLVSYPLIVGGRVFVTVAEPGQNGDGPNFTELYALNASNGSVAWGPIQLGSIRADSTFSAIAYDDGRVFAVNEAGQVTAFEAATGYQDWTTPLDGFQSLFDSPPTASGGIVYVGGAGSQGTVFALDESDGAILWTATVENGDESSPAVTSTGVYVSYDANQIYDFAPTTGNLIWHDSEDGAEGGGGRTPVYYDGDLYVRNTDENLVSPVLSAATGAQLGTLTAQMPPAFDNSLEFTVTHGTLAAIDTSTGTELWSQTADGTLDTAPIVVGGNVYVGGTSGLLVSYDEYSGAETWSTNVGNPILDPAEWEVGPLQAMGAGDGLLVVPATDTLVAFGSGTTSVPPPSGGTAPTPPPSGGTTPTPPSGAGGAPTAPTTGAAATTNGPGIGYTMAASDGGIFNFGEAGYFGSQGGKTLDKPVVGMATTPDGGGYWEVASDGGIFAFGDAYFCGSMGGRPLDSPIVGIATTPEGGGYWEVASDGGIFAFGDAHFYGSMGGKSLDSPIVGIAATPDGGGYWEVASDGGIFNFGDAHFYGSMGGRPLNAQIVGISASPSGHGYLMVSSDGGLFAFGDAHFYGAMGGHPLNKPIVGVVVTPDGGGYWEVASDGGIFNFGDAAYYGSQGGKPLDKPIVGMAGG
jgi:outer membrane protein assembly factor BamB